MSTGGGGGALAEYDSNDGSDPKVGSEPDGPDPDGGGGGGGGWFSLMHRA